MHILRPYNQDSCPDFEEEVLCLVLSTEPTENPIIFIGHFEKGPRGSGPDFLFRFNDEYAVDGENIEIDFWMPYKDIL